MDREEEEARVAAKELCRQLVDEGLEAMRAEALELRKDFAELRRRSVMLADGGQGEAKVIARAEAKEM